jgi:hypothetical protein
MFMGLQLIIGLREQNTIALSWILMALTMFFGLAQETWSRPGQRDPDGYRGWVGDPVRTPQVQAAEEKRRGFRDRYYIQAPTGPNRPYAYRDAMASADAEERAKYQRESAPAPEPLSYQEKMVLRAYTRAYTVNYFYRMIPHFIGWFPYVAAWVVYFNHFFGSLNDLRAEDEDLFERVPDFVPYAIIGTGIFFTSFTFVQWRYQYISPDFVSHSPNPVPTVPKLTLVCPIAVLEDRNDLLFPLSGGQTLPRFAAFHQRAHVLVVCRGYKQRRLVWQLR